MSETVKLIIEIPKELHEALLNGYEEPYSKMLSDVVKNGIPLDDVKAEIDEKISHYEHFSSSNTANGLIMAKEIIEKYKGDKEC